MSGSDTIVIKRLNLELHNILKFKEPISQISMVWRLESSWVCLVLLPMILVLVVVTS